ncbi:MAG: HAMP domain-containing protein, partial [Elusimicrobia bacterium]|nr:HAMP domain-containing protein [Elusimicrobiota bacterium]
MSAAYFLLASSLRRRDRSAIVSSLAHMRDEYNDEGLRGIEREAAVQISRQGKDAHVIRLLSRNGRELLKMRTASWNGFDLQKAIPAIPRSTLSWNVLPGTRDGQIMELASWRLSNGDIIQVGNSDAAREDVLDRFRWILAAVFLPAVLLGFIGGFLIARRALQPVQDLIQTLEAVKSGTMGARAPDRCAGGELADLTGIFNTMMERIESLVRGMKNALDNVAHDLRTPMTRLRAVAELPLRSEAGGSDCREALADCVEESDKVLAML